MGAFAAVFALVAALPAQPAEPASDQHLSDPAAALYQRSPFAHGYIHGYEEGFHVGDQDLQFGRLTRGDRRKTSAGHPRPALRGESASFREGYDQGFTAGYRDSVAGREFRAIAALRQAAAALGEGARAQDDGGFDAAFMTGYFAGEAYVVKSAKPIRDFNYVAAYCAANAGRAKPKAIAEADASAAPPDCAAYAQGFRLGYNDARAQQPAQATASAK